MVVGPAMQARDIHGDVYFHAPSGPLPRPSQLPPTSRVTGRAAEVARLDAARPDGLIALTGPPGVGKTALAVHWGHRIRTDFPDGALFADLHGHAPDGPAAPSEVLGRFLRALGIAAQQVPAELAEQTALYRSATADRQLIVVLDDALSTAQVQPLLPSSSASVTVITSRWRLARLSALGARIIQLGRLTPESALELLGQTLGDDRIEAEPEAAGELVHLCAGLPLAVCVAGARLAARPQWPVREMVTALGHEQQRLAALTLEGDNAVRASLDLSYRALGTGEARMYRLMGLYPGTLFDSGVAAAVADVPRTDARRLLGVLADANLLDDAALGQYRCHDLTRLHAQEVVERDESTLERATAVRRMLDWFLAAVTSAGAVIMPYRRGQPRDLEYPPAEQDRFTSAEDALSWLDRQLGNIAAAIRLAVATARPALAWQLTDALWPLFLHRGHYAERLEIDRLGLAAATACADEMAEAKMHNRVGMALRDLRQLDEAAEHFRHALAIWQQRGNDDRVAGSLRRLGALSVDGGQLTEAIDYFTRALNISRRLGSPRKVALALSDLGAALTGAGQPAAAAGRLREAAALLADQQDPFNEARVLIRLGIALGQDGQGAAAKASLDRALASMGEIGSTRGQADALIALGELAENGGQPSAARPHYEAALALLSRLGVAREARLRERLERLNETGAG